ncbi:HlyD family efflux transporter periplasmic adaptor subunit [Dactylosporangium roseum]|uniref:HlyD family efflux transporter periplasmic adaptor subunit n=1 Tax=Dactylosporangium roseum TaxID=47989 RepID=A0ABY5Z8G5_9ACTN|nr:HlyD family efflux transporter periplasmic adaptor subunit [Dactylosporangium roseum]UWZ37305.1 HlyD family efflux transporter periplasmic adaptor subunit [Dactylosporangium roseum]
MACVYRVPPRVSLVVSVALFSLVSLTAASCDGENNDIGLGNAGRADVIEVVDAPATVTARAAATLTAAADGTLVSLSVKPGDTVTAGQVLAVIDSPSAQQRLTAAGEALDALKGARGGGGGIRNLSATQKKTDDAAAKAFADARGAAQRIADQTVRAALLHQIDLAERTYQEAAASARALITAVQRGLASVDRAMSALTAAQRAQAQAAYDLARSTVDALTLRAPVAGVVQPGGTSAASAPSITDLLGAAGAGAAGATVDVPQQSGPGVDPAVPVGGRVAAGTAILTVVDVSELGLMAEVDETDVLLVQPGVAARVELDAAPGATYEATVTSADVLPTASARGGVSYRSRLKLGAGRYADGRPAPTPRPGMNAVAHLEVRSIRDAVTVPAAAVFNVGGNDVVWLVRAGKAVQTPVSIGVSGQDRVQVLTGVADGDRLVVRGTDKVKQGMDLRR